MGSYECCKDILKGQEAGGTKPPSGECWRWLEAKPEARAQAWPSTEGPSLLSAEPGAGNTHIIH